MFLGRIKPLFIKEIRQIIRDKLSLGIIILVPVFMLVMFGYALNFDVKNISLAVFDEDNSRISREFIEKFVRSGYFNLNYSVNKSGDLDRLLNENDISAALVIPSEFSRNLIKGDTVSLQVLIDGSNSNTASTIIGYTNAIITEYSTKILAEKVLLKTNQKLANVIDYRPRVWYNSELKSVKFLIPGLIGFILLITSVISTSLSIVKEKERGTMEQILVSPVKPLELIIGKTTTYIIIALITALLIFIAGYYMFDVIIKGSYFLLFISIILYLASSLGIGLLISSISDTQQVAFMISAIVTMLPTFVLSGFVFPIANMPIFIQLITYIVPARYFFVILREIVLKGAGINAFWIDMLMLTIYSFVTLFLSTLRMRKRTLL